MGELDIHEAKRKPMIVVGTKKEIGHRIADIGPGGKEYNVQTNAAWDKAQKDKMKKGMKEAKDKGEYDYEGDMAMSQLKTICRHAEHFMEMLKPDTNLPEWVQSKITLATDYIQTAHDYMMSEVDEAYSDPYAAKKSAEMKKAQAATMADAKKEYDAAKKPKFAKNFMKMKKEEVENIDELSKKTLGSYVKKAVDDKSDADFHAGRLAKTDDEDKVHGAIADRFKKASANQAIRRSERRSAGINAAVKKITKEEVEQISEEEYDAYRDHHLEQGTWDKEKSRVRAGGTPNYGKYLNKKGQYRKQLPSSKMKSGDYSGKMKKEEVETATEEFKKGDTVYPKIGPHAGHPHKVIHSLENGTHNIQPIGLSPKRTKYRLGAANAKSHELSVTKEEVEEVHEGKIKRAIVGAMAAVALSGAANTAHAQAPQKTSNDSVATATSRDMQLSVDKAKHELRKKGIEQPSGHRQDVKTNADGTYTATVDYRKPKKEEVELTELKNKTLRSYRFKAKIAAPTTRAPGRERAGEILKKRKDAYLAKKATKAFSSRDRLDARTKDVHPYGADD